MPRVTVLTVVRDGAPFLEQTLESIRRQTMTDFEYIIVDDASRDATPRIVERAAARDQRIQLLRREAPGGPFVAANEGLRHARGELIARTDADDISLPLRLHRQSAFLEARPRLSACATWSRALDDCKGLSAIPCATASLKWLLCLGCVVVHSSLCIRRTELIARGGYRELPLAQDYDLFCELARRGAIAVVPELHVLFRRPFRRVSITRRREQDRYSEQILAEHLKAMIGSSWTSEQVQALFAAGRCRRFPIGAAMHTLAQWERLWRGDRMLTEQERTEIEVECARRRRVFLRANARAQPLAFLIHLMDYFGRHPAAVPLGA